MAITLKSTHEVLIGILRDAANQLEGKPHTCTVTIEKDGLDNIAYTIRTTFEPLDNNRIAPDVTEIKISSLRRIAPGR